MSTQRKRYSAALKARVALEALKGLKTVNELASTYGVHPTQIAHWKHRLQKEMPEIFWVCPTFYTAGNSASCGPFSRKSATSKERYFIAW